MQNPLSWTNDPFLFDTEPSPVNQWLNANELIQQNRSNEIFLPESQQLNLFPIMVRRNDFVRVKSSDRIMARFPFMVLSKESQERIKDKILLLSELTRDYFYKSINKSIIQWKEDILRYLERGTIPYPIVRNFFKLEPTRFSLCNDSVLFTSARGDKFKMPTTLTKELAYLAGMVNGDGNLQKYTLRIVDYSISNIKQLQAMFQEYFTQTGNILYKTPNSPEVVITNLWVVRLFSFLTGQPIGMKKYAHLGEPLIFKQEPFRNYYWSGVMDADGGYKSRQAYFVSASLRYAKAFKTFLSENGIGAKLIERDDNTVRVSIPNRFHDKLRTILVSLHPEKKPYFESLSTTFSRSVSIFTGYNSSTLIDGYFNFRLMDKLSVIGLGQLIRQFRDKQSRRIFAEKLKVNERTIQAIEEETMSINVHLLDRILLLYNLQLMPFLTQHDFILYQIGGSKIAKLDTRPNENLTSLLKPLKFYTHVIRIPTTNDNLKQNLENHFKRTIYDDKIVGKLLLHFFSKFCETKPLETYV